MRLDVSVSVVPLNHRLWGAAGESQDPLGFSEIADTWESHDASDRLFDVGDGLSGIGTARGTLLDGELTRQVVARQLLFARFLEPASLYSMNCCWD